jgi:hypothetical protein
MAEENSINDQIKDSITQIQQSVMGVFESQGQAAAYQMMAHAIGLAMLNAVSNQQHAYILRNAITTAAVKAVLKSNPEEAIKLADKMLAGQDIVSTFSGLKEMMDDVLEIMAKMKEEAASPPPKGEAKTTKETPGKPEEKPWAKASGKNKEKTK